MWSPSRSLRRRGTAGLAALLLIAAALWWREHQPSPLCPHPPRPEGIPEATVVDAVDGDTVEVEFRGRVVRVRLIGVDTPELRDPRPPIRETAQRAAQFTRSRLSGQRVGLEFDVEEHDQYGRLLAYVWVDDRLFNLELLESGYARLYTVPPNVRYVSWLRDCQRLARET